MILHRRAYGQRTVAWDFRTADAARWWHISRVDVVVFLACFAAGILVGAWWLG